ncbi:MAG: hypothetical protein U0795_27040 [Pirellulales bacterium]
MPKKRTGNKSLLLSTPVYNELADAAEWVKFHRGGPRFDTRRSGESQSWIWLRNDTGASLVPGNVVGIGPPTVTDSQNPVSFQYQVAHQAVLPTVAVHATRLAVVLEACPPGEWFAGLVAGVASVNIYVSAAHLADWQGRASVDGTVSQLVSDPAGPVIVLWCGSAAAGQTAPQISGLQKARVLLPATAAAATQLPRLGRLEADLAYNGTASVRLLTGAVGAESPSSPAVYVTAHNLVYRTLWSGANVSMVPHDVTGADPATYRIIWSDAASRVRGVSDAAIGSGTSGLVSSLVPIDGRVGPGSSITAHSVLANFNVPGGVAVWCEWTDVNSRWEIYSADCPPPSP